MSSFAELHKPSNGIEVLTEYRNVLENTSIQNFLAAKRLTPRGDYRSFSTALVEISEKNPIEKAICSDKYL